MKQHTDFRSFGPALRPGSLSGLTLALAAALAALTSPQAQAQTNISGQSAPYLWDSSNTNIAVSGGGVVTGGSTANALYTSGSVGTLTNLGSISGVIGLVNDAGNTISQVNNSISNGFIGTIHGEATGIQNAGVITLLNNAGVISGGTIGNTIFSNTLGILNAGVIDTLVNTGVIGGGYVGIANVGSIHSLNNSGTITGGFGIMNGGTIGTLNNSGLITGAGFAMTGLVSGVIETIVNSGTIQGDILDVSTIAGLHISGGSGTSFGTLTGLNGSIGNIYSNLDMTLSGGNLLLNDNVGFGVGFSISLGYTTSGIGTLTNAGSVLQVNNHITINGSYQQNAAATLVIGVGDSAVSNGTVSDTGYGRLIVTGDAVVASGSSIALKKLNSYSFATGQRFVVIQASGSGTNYNASTLNYSATGYSATGTQIYDGSYYNLVVTVADAITGATSAVNAATTGNATAALNGLFNYSGTNGEMLNFYNAAVVAGSSRDTANRVGARLSPSATRSAVGDGVRTVLDTVQGAAGERINGMRGGSGISSGETSLSPALWGRVFGGRANQGERDGIAGYHASYGGVIIGGDALVAPDWRLGGLFNYARTNVGNDGDNSGSSAGVNSYGLMGYAGFDGKPWYVNLTAGLARQQYSTTRDVSFTDFSGIANGSYNGTLATTSVQAGYPLALASLTLTPLAGLNYSTLRQNGYTESGGNGAALTVDGNTANSLKSQLGMKLERSFSTSYGILQPAAQLSWNHEFRDFRLSNTASFAADSRGATSFSTLGTTPLRNTAQLSLGATLLKNENLSLSARYTVEVASGYTAQTGNVSLRWQY
jgi:outer membrane autotransporter protein